MGGSTEPTLSEAVRGLMPSVRASFFRFNEPAHGRLGMYAPRARRRLFRNYMQRQQIQLQVPQVPEVMDVMDVMEIPMEIEIIEDQENQPPAMGNHIILVMEEIQPQPVIRPPGPRLALQLLNAEGQEAEA
ncbi:Ba37 [Baboon cytomegalovirus]|nr:Ba37 [Baboon cytomegalovirus]